MNLISKFLTKLKDPSSLLMYIGSKEGAEESFWRREIYNYQEWMSGRKKDLYNTSCPLPEEIIYANNLKDSAVLTWHKKHQENKYLADLELSPNDFKGMRILDIGSGPMPSATCFKNCELYCLEPLLDKYLAAGFPIHYYGNVKYIHAKSENIPVPDNFFDVVISVNAIDHVNDIVQTSLEIKRILRPGGLFRMHVHYHPPTRAEPIHFNDNNFLEIFKWCENLVKISEKKINFSNLLKNEESYALWTNFRI